MELESNKNAYFEKVHDNQNLYYLEQREGLRDGPSEEIQKWELEIKIEEARNRLKYLDEELEKQNTPERNVAVMKK